MKLKLILVSIFLLTTSSVLLGQRLTRVKKVESHVTQEVVLGSGQSDKTIADILAIAPNLPRGPQELLQDYRNQMTLVSQALSAELGVIAQAVQSGQIKQADAEYLIQERYQLALMQYQVFTALHDSLEFAMVQTSDAAASAQRSCRQDAVVVVQGQPSLACNPGRNPTD